GPRRALGREAPSLATGGPRAGPARRLPGRADPSELSQGARRRTAGRTETQVDYERGPARRRPWPAQGAWGSATKTWHLHRGFPMSADVFPTGSARPAESRGRVVYLLARRLAGPPAAPRGLASLGSAGWGWTRERGRALTFASREDAEAWLDALPPELEPGFVLWEQRQEGPR